MWVFLLFIAAVIVWPGSAQDQQVYLTTHDHWAFWKIRVTGQMTGSNVKATCEAAGMRYPCHQSGSDGCTNSYHWTSDCITFDAAGVSCLTHYVLSSKLCVNTNPRQCQPLDDTFVYCPVCSSGSSACGVVNGGYCIGGSGYSNLYALCAVATCARSPCTHGICTDDGRSYTCSCESGWTGHDCDQNIDECASSPCAHGTCTDDIASYTCSCENGWAGTNCQIDIDECASSPCGHGTCRDGVGGYTCNCENGWTGPLCEIDIDDCASSPCIHGTCTDVIASYTCSCENGWGGTNCDQDIDECASNPCWLGGTCLDHVDGYSCVCPEDTTGKNCETVSFAGECYQFSATAANHRDATRACSTNDGRMVDVKDQQHQQFLADTIAATTGVSNWLAMKTAPIPILYSDGSPVIGALQWSSDEPSSPLDLCVLLDSSDNYNAKTAFCTEQHNYVCQSALKPCAPNVCQNGGNCSSCFGGSGTFCDCLDGFQGKSCEINTDECASSPCQHGGTCQDDVNSYSCRCPTGYDGDNCEVEIDWCAMVTCPFDWTCQNLITHFSCLAPTVRMVAPYKCSSASCPGDMYCKEESGGASFSCWAN